MTAGPETHYTRSADGTNLAYQVSGEGPLGLVFVPSPAPVDLLSDDPGCVRLQPHCLVGCPSQGCVGGRPTGLPDSRDLRH